MVETGIRDQVVVAVADVYNADGICIRIHYFRPETESSRMGSTTALREYRELLSQDSDCAGAEQ